MSEGVIAPPRVPRGCVIQVCFHGVGEPKRPLEHGESAYWISQDRFLKLLDTIAVWPDVRLSFDDGNASDEEIVLPALRERGLTATFFVVAGRLGQPGSLDETGLGHLQAAGMRIGSHGWRHEPWTVLSKADMTRELHDARERIAAAIGCDVQSAALPLGRYDRAVLTALKKAGYSSVATSDRKLSTEGSWLQHRFSARATDTPAALKQTVEEAAKPMNRLVAGAKGLAKRWR
jgi:peptidoglycan/xylan/chitin deacetylase (PgdA/CDA1 family)